MWIMIEGISLISWKFLFISNIIGHINLEEQEHEKNRRFCSFFIGKLFIQNNSCTVNYYSIKTLNATKTTNCKAQQFVSPENGIVRGKFKAEAAVTLRKNKKIAILALTQL